MDKGRRSFLRKTGQTVMGIGCGLPLLSAGCGALQEGLGHDEPAPGQLAMVIDVQKCLDREVQDECVKACNKAHSIPTEIPEAKDRGPKDEVKWIWPEQYEHVFPDQAHKHTEERLAGKPVLVLCNHCTDPPCVRVCPTKATWKREESDGIVMMDMHRCIGCRYCIAACPYGARSFNWRDPVEFIKPENRNATYPHRTKGVVEKCNFCAERLREGDQPACVEAVMTLAERRPEVKDALVFGEFSSPDVRKVLNENHSICRRLNLGTGPNVFYIV